MLRQTIRREHRAKIPCRFGVCDLHPWPLRATPRGRGARGPGGGAVVGEARAVVGGPGRAGPVVGGARGGTAGTWSALGEVSNLGLGLEVSTRFCPRPEAVEAQRPGSHQRPSGFRSPGTVPSCYGRGLAGHRGQGARLAPARTMGPACRQLLQPGAGRGRKAGARAATHQRAAAGRHQVSGEAAGALASLPLGVARGPTGLFPVWGGRGMGQAVETWEERQAEEARHRAPVIPRRVQWGLC